MGKKTSLDTTAPVHTTDTIHDFRARDFRAHNGWHATMTRHGRGRQPQYEARIHDAQGRDAQGRDVRGIWIYTNLKDAKLTVEERIQQLATGDRM